MESFEEIDYEDLIKSDADEAEIKKDNEEKMFK